jgi:hypothetical protein
MTSPSRYAVRFPSTSARKAPPPRGSSCSGSDTCLIGWQSTRTQGPPGNVVSVRGYTQIDPTASARQEASEPRHRLTCGGCAPLCDAPRSPSSCASAAVVAEAVPGRVESLVGSSCEEFQASETGRQSLRKRTDCRSLRVLQLGPGWDVWGSLDQQDLLHGVTPEPSRSRRSRLRESPSSPANVRSFGFRS